MKDRSPVDYCPYCGGDDVSLALQMSVIDFHILDHWNECKCGAEWKWPPAAKG